MKAHVNPDTCIGCGLCVDISPEVFEMDDEGLARVIDGADVDGSAGDVKEAAEQCPVDAIEVED